MGMRDTRIPPTFRIMKIRIYDVARAVFGTASPGLSLGDLVRAAEAYGAKTHSSAVTLADARELREQFRHQLAPRAARRQAWRQHKTNLNWKQFSLA